MTVVGESARRAGTEPAVTQTFFVPGIPRPQGSKNHIGGGKMKESSAGLEEWRMRVGFAANRVRGHSSLITGPVKVTVEFIMPRPKYLKPTDIADPHTHPPDLDKLLRGVLDALTGTLLRDDSLVTHFGEGTHKRTATAAEPPGAHIRIEAL